MKKIKRLGGLSLVCFVLAACTASPSAQDVANQVQEKAAEVESYQADIQLDLDVRNSETEAVILDTKTTMEITINEETMDTYGQLTADNEGSITRQQYYSIGEQAYIKIDDHPWADVSMMQEDYFQNNDTFYASLLPIIQELAESAKLTVESGHYVFHFEGKDAELFQSFAAPYQLAMGDLPPEEVEQQVVVKINQDTLFIESVENLLTGENSGNNIHFYISHRFENINQTGEFTIPPEVIEKADQP